MATGPAHTALTSYDVDLQPNMHVYAPGVETATSRSTGRWRIPILAQVAHAPAYPRAEKLFLKAIDETVSRVPEPFPAESRDITIPAEEKLKAMLDGRRAYFTTPPNSSLRYQACDDRGPVAFRRLCPCMQWTFEYQGSSRQRAVVLPSPCQVYSAKQDGLAESILLGVRGTSRLNP